MRVCRYKYAKNFEKFAELLVQAISHCIPLPHQYDIALGAAAKAELEALRTEVAAVLKFEVALAAPRQQQQDAFQHWCIVGGVANPKLQYLSQLVSVAYAFEISRKLPFDPAAVLEALQSGPPSGVLDWSKSVLPELRRTPSSCFSNRNPSCLSLIPVDAASVAALADALANADGAHFIQYASFARSLTQPSYTCASQAVGHARWLYVPAAAGCAQGATGRQPEGGARAGASVQ